MKPLKLTMQAFGSYVTPGTIDFQKPEQNLFLVTGDTGAGKTTIFDAIVFALYGETSSGMNRKNGNELQSQYADPGLDPFVELTFSEGEGASQQIYTVRRTPRHIRPLKRGTGTKEEKETVSLTMPDETEFSQNKKETDEKLVEILGLTKNQFMQVAMIAQGEFMELLRAKSDDKKVIFRKLFNTEPYQKIVEELGLRRKEKQQEIAKIRTECQTEMGHIEIPEAYERGSLIQEIMQRIIKSERFRVTDMEQLLQELKLLCNDLKERQQEAEKQAKAAEEERSCRQEILVRATQLQQAFEQLAQAELTLKTCEADAKRMQEQEVLVCQIRSAYDIQGSFERMQDSQNAVKQTKKALENCKEQVPRLKHQMQELLEQEKTSDAQQKDKNESYNRVSERVTQALKVFQEIEEAQTAIQEKSVQEETAQEDVAAVQEQQDQLRAQIQVWKAIETEKKDAPTQLVYWQNQKKEAEELSSEIKEADRLHKEWKQQCNQVTTAQKAFREASEQYQEMHSRYEAMRQIFFNMQAGLIAREQLKPGQPCPVCGSLEHPSPCELAEEHSEITREKLDMFSADIERLRAVQENCAAQAHAAGELAKEKEQQAQTAMEKLFGHMQEQLSEIPETMELALAEAVVNDWKSQLKEEEKLRKADVAALEDAQKKLEDAEKTGAQLEERLQKVQKRQQELTVELEGQRAVLDKLTKSQTYASKEAAQEELLQATQEKKQTEDIYKKVYEQAAKAKTALDETEALQKRYTEELPSQEVQYGQRRSAYETLMSEYNLTEENWKQSVEQYRLKDAERLQEEISAYKETIARAKGICISAKEQIGEQEKPDLERLQQERDTAEQRYQEKQTELEQWKIYVRADCGTYEILKPKMDDRAQILTEHQQISELYNRLAGNVSGSRMDLETFVQRQYLEKILYAANRRFLEMSAGQFELRLYDLEKAGEGKNHGLDLMVYSAVTGKVREVRTLSGGESFMAALSLALGMADQIQESSAAIHLDVMFIDEGFGSLDENSRNQAVRVLQEMAGGNKLIGIISHVTELKQQIDDQLIVNKDEKGSHVRWQIS